MRQQIADCLKETIGQYYSFEQEEMEDAVENMYNVCTVINKKKKNKQHV